MAQDSKNKGTTQEGNQGGSKGKGPAKPDAYNKGTGTTKQLTDDQGERDQVRTGLKGDEALQTKSHAGDAKRKEAGKEQTEHSAK